MNPIRFIALPALALGLATTPPLEADVYKGRVNFKGEMQDLAKPASLSFTFRGILKDRKGYRARVSGGGLFHTKERDLSKATFTGRMKIYVRVAGRSGARGRLVRRNSNKANVGVTNRTVRFDGARIRLKAPVDGYRDEAQKLRGKGRYRVRV